MPASVSSYPLVEFSCFPNSEIVAVLLGVTGAYMMGGKKPLDDLSVVIGAVEIVSAATIIYGKYVEKVCD
jgi:hypothetical protein